MKVTDKKIKQYCDSMGYKLLRIGKIAFEYEKPNGQKSALLKSAAHSLDHKKKKQPGEGYGSCNCGSEGCCRCNPW